MKTKCTACQAPMTTHEARWILDRGLSEGEIEALQAAAQDPPVVHAPRPVRAFGAPPAPTPHETDPLPTIRHEHFCSLACLAKWASSASATGGDPVAKRRAIESGAARTGSQN